MPEASLGILVLIIILAIALIVIGPNKLPDLAKSLGRAIGEFKKATRELKDAIQMDDDIQEVKTTFNDIKKDMSLQNDNLTHIIDSVSKTEDLTESQEVSSKEQRSAGNGSEGSLKDA